MGKVSVSSPDIHVITHVLQTLPPLAEGAQQPATIDPTVDLCTMCPLQLGGPRQCGIRSLPNAFTHDQHWELNPIPQHPVHLASLLPHFRYSRTCSAQNK